MSIVKRNVYFIPFVRNWNYFAVNKFDSEEYKSETHRVLSAHVKKETQNIVVNHTCSPNFFRFVFFIFVKVAANRLNLSSRRY